MIDTQQLSRSRSFSEPMCGSNPAIVVVGSPDGGGDALSPTTTAARSAEKSAAHAAARRSRQIRNEQAFLAWLKRDGGGGGGGAGTAGDPGSGGADPGTRASRSRSVATGLRSAHPTAAFLKDLKMHRHSLTYRGAMLNINRYRLRASSCPDIYRNSMTTIAKEKVQWGQTVEEIRNLFADMLDLSYFADIRFLLFAMSNFFLYTWYDVPYVYLTDYAGRLGHSDTDASLLISYIGIVNMFGEVSAAQRSEAIAF